MLSNTKLFTTSLFMITLLAWLLACSYAPFSFAQQTEIITQEYRPAWGNIPSVQRPSFSYSEVQNSKLISEAGERLDFLSIDHLIVGSVRNNQSADGNRAGFQVIGPRGNIFYVDNIEKPKCAVFAQYVEGDGKNVRSNNIVSNVYIEEIDFTNCN